MKVAVLLAYAVLTTKRVTCAAIQPPADIISLDDITEADRRYLEYLNGYFYPPRPKRSGEDALNSLKASIGQGIKAKLGQLAKGSASASAKLSKGSSSYNYHDHPETHDHKSFDLWSLKKSILNTLLQAVKAIKGGVIAIKGQLIKGSGYLISAKGKLISNKGEAITKLGKNIATSAVLSHPHGHSEEYSHGHYHHSGPSEEYGSPSAPGPEYEVPEHHYHHHEDKPDADHAGILILKKIPEHHDHSEHHPAEHKIPDFKHIGHKDPGFGEIIGKFFSASTSLKPGYPNAFGDEHEHHHYPGHHHSPEHHHPDHSSHDHEEYRESPDSSHHDSHHEYSSPVHATSHDPRKPHSPFEEAPAFLNVAEYASESKGAPQTAPKAQPKPEAQKLQATPATYDDVRPLSAFTSAGYDMSSLLRDSDKANLFLSTVANKPNVAFPPQHVKPTAFASDATSLQFGGFPNPGFDSGVQFLAPPDVGPQVFPRQNPFGNVNSYPAYPQSLKYHALLDNAQSSSYKGLVQRPTRSKNHGRKRPSYPSPEFMKHLMYDLGPNGPKRL